MKNEKYYVYFYYGNDNTLLYIGKSIDVGMRWQGHQEEWKSKIVKIGVREYPDHAAMDIYEQYYIKRCMSKYNIAGLQHGYTDVEILDPYEMKVYSVEDFEDKYVKRYSKEIKRKHSKRIRKSFLEELQMNNISIIEAEEVNLIDERLLEYNLDKVYFKYKNIFFVPGRDDETGYSTNERFLCLKEFLKKATIRVQETELGARIVYSTNIDMTVADEAFKCGRCEFITTKITKSGLEKKSGWMGVNVFSMLVNTDTGFEIRLSACSDLVNCFFIDKHNFRVNLKKIYENEREVKKR